MDQEKNAPNNDNHHYLVGIGASAGGLEALEKFFKSMPGETGLSFVVVLHLSPDYKSLMVELLSKQTSMDVFHVTDGIEVAPNCVYVIPRKKNLTIFHGKLYLTDQEERSTHILNLPIDIFFRSLADDQGERAIGIILSGTGSDGTRGIRAIKEAGGMVMVQDESSAKFDGMPRSAISTGLVDYILAPEQMPVELQKYVQHPLVSGRRQEPLMVRDDDNLRKILAAIRSHSGVDFVKYKQSTVLRRIERRMSINQIDRLKDYVEFMYQSRKELDTLYKELLIGVTKFFRDTEAFETVKARVIPDIFDRKGRTDSIRVWVPGCSTGEEAYSLAILFKEYMDKNGISRDVKLFATDIDRNALENASIGMYPESIAADVSLNYLKQYFVKTGENYQLSRAIREMVIFAAQNIIKDPPFSKIDLVSCRNMLIYLQSPLQRKVISLFQFALNPNGYLFLGTSETVGDAIDFFNVQNNKWKIYQYRGGFKFPMSDSVQMDETRSIQPISPAQDYRPQRVGGEDERAMIESLYKALVKEFLPTCAVVNEDFQLVHAFGEINKYLMVSTSDRASLDILKMIRKDLSVALATALHRVVKNNSEVVYQNVTLSEGDDTLRINLKVKPFLEWRSRQKFILVNFEDVDVVPTTSENTEQFEIDSKMSQRVADLEQELQYSKENLQATIEELETSNEELQATNEELVAANEELQSTNEELQSVNEELITLNSEYQVKIQELTDLNNDMNNLLGATNIGTIFLDRDLNVRKFTPAVQNEMNLLNQDVGRPIAHVSHNFDDLDLVEQARAVLDDLQAREQELQSKSGKWYSLRILPYRTTDGSVRGVVVTLIDINRQKEAETALQQEHDLMRRITETSFAGISVVDKEGQLIFCNHQAEKILGLNRDEATKRTYNAPEWKILGMDGKPLPDKDLPFTKVMQTKKPVNDVRHMIEHPNGQRIVLSINGSPLFDNEGTVLQVVFTLRDITKDLEQIQEMKDSEERFRRLSQATFEGIVMVESGQVIDANVRFAEIFDYPLEKIMDQAFTNFIEVSDRKQIKERLEAGDDHPFKIRGLKKDGTSFLIEVRSRSTKFKRREMRILAIRDLSREEQMQVSLREHQRAFRIILLSSDGSQIKQTREFFDDMTLHHDLKSYKSWEALKADLENETFDDDNGPELFIFDDQLIKPDELKQIRKRLRKGQWKAIPIIIIQESYDDSIADDGVVPISKPLQRAEMFDALEQLDQFGLRIQPKAPA